MQYIVRVASYDSVSKRASVFNLPARDYKDAEDIKDQLEATESRHAMICIRLHTRAGSVLLNVDELSTFAAELGTAINDTRGDMHPKFKSA